MGPHNYSQHLVKKLPGQCSDARTVPHCSKPSEGWLFTQGAHPALPAGTSFDATRLCSLLLMGPVCKGPPAAGAHPAQALSLRQAPAPPATRCGHRRDPESHPPRRPHSSPACPHAHPTAKHLCVPRCSLHLPWSPWWKRSPLRAGICITAQHGPATRAPLVTHWDESRANPLQSHSSVGLRSSAFLLEREDEGPPSPRGLFCFQ